MHDWRESDITDQSGRVAVITGANTGIGFATALALARHGASVVLACRNPDRAEDAVRRIAGHVPGAATRVVTLDLASLASVRAAAAEIAATCDRIDLLINNAGVNGRAGRTRDGFEVHFGVNYLGHFALTGLLLERMLGVAGSRVVTISSVLHHAGEMDLGKLGDPRNAYARAKLANLMFSYQLQRRLDAAEAVTIAVTAHPGTASTEITRDLPAWIERPTKLLIGQVFGRTAARGAQPVLRAALDPRVCGGDFYGPGDPIETFGSPTRVRGSRPARDAGLQVRLWAEAERLTGVRYRIATAG